MTVKLWTVYFMRIGIANLLLFISLYMLFPMLPIEMTDRLGIPIEQSGVIFLFFIMGMFLFGPFFAYLVDAYKRKHVYILSFTAMIAATMGYAFVTNMTELILLGTLQGLAFGIATSSGVTLTIDATNTTLRSAGNISFSWMVLIGMTIGVILGVWLYQNYSFINLLSVSVIIGILGILTVSGVYVPFRAPIVTKKYSFDRFLLLRGWLPAINLSLITFVPGLLILPVHPFLNDYTLETIHAPMPFFFGTGIGLLVALAMTQLFFLKERSLRLVGLGMSLQIISMLLLQNNETTVFPSIFLGMGLGFVIPEFLVMFIKLSYHCQRGTANTTHLLASEMGFFLGMACACYMNTDEMIFTARVVALVALLFFAFITYPYYFRMKIR